MREGQPSISTLGQASTGLARLCISRGENFLQLPNGFGETLSSTKMTSLSPLRNVQEELVERYRSRNQPVCMRVIDERLQIFLVLRGEAILPWVGA